MTNKRRMAAVLIGLSGTGDLQAAELLEALGKDNSIWLALFGLAMIGILALYLSSEKVKGLNRQYRTMRSTQKEIELRQNIILGVIGERLKTSTDGIRRHRQVFEQQTVGEINEEVIRSDMVKFRWDEYLLIDAMRDLGDFSLIRSGKLLLETSSFAICDMLARLATRGNPHYFLKHNTFEYRYPEQEIGMVAGDAKRIEQVMYDGTAILSLHPAVSRDEIEFDLMIRGQIEGTSLFDDALDVEMVSEEIPHSSRKLKAYLAQELTLLMGGSITSVRDSDSAIHYRIVLPLRTIPVQASGALHAA